ncbi:MAG TPA: biotin transporter BioY [Cryomorphaceae bacterium]|nr:biotin biosynthesis protein BioY [Owenweeksia sp.]MBF97937.1 biotin biosynthesis protein BioY [Owenweeksia sp.]HAD98032.1 biotin transporter BioY [Cryomorphaceae bacterium]HBF20891.1 biotin transporter BioY [Cryomorphaceae bacterium]HCQ15274.1 biotin transporter BioY [Cryomorphaceae bacterium]|tara:strand:- start:3065 stop:3619 length:555 start_codon:yes stop_codon:yes gene_type:complete
MSSQQIKIIITALVITCLVAPVKFDVVTIPITLQTLVLFCIPAVFGKRVGFTVAALYLLLGAAGLPVYAGFQGGYQKLYGPTAGFLWAFPFINYYIGWACERVEANFFYHIVIFVRAHFLLLVPGFIVLYLSLEGVQLWDTFILLLPGLFIKSIVGGILTAYLIKKLPPQWVEAPKHKQTNLST